MSNSTFMFVGDEDTMNEVLAKAKKRFAAEADLFIIFQTITPGKRQAIYSVFQGHKITLRGADTLPPNVLTKARTMWGEQWPDTRSKRNNYVMWVQHIRIRTSGAGEVVKQALSRAAEPSDLNAGFEAPTRSCIVCGKEKPLAEFCIKYTVRAHKEGLKKEHCHSYCKECNSMYNKWRGWVLQEFHVGSIAEAHMLDYESSGRWLPFRKWLEMQTEAYLDRSQDWEELSKWSVSPLLSELLWAKIYKVAPEGK